jgi:hypothetical protein
MIRVALDSFARRDLVRAEALVELDELIDRANRRTVEEVLTLADRMREVLDRLIPSGVIEVARPLGESAGPAERLRGVGYDSAAKGHAFVAMPFDKAFNDIHHFGIAPSVRAAGLLCERMDHLTFTGDIVAHMKDRIGRARFVVADLTGANPNVYLEVGYAWGRDVPTILLCREGTEPTFDVRGHRYLVYDSIRQLNEMLTDEIAALVRRNTPQ